MNEEDESVFDLSLMAWVRYNPEWLIDKVDGNKNDTFIFSISDVREAYRAGFTAGVTFKITKEIPRVDDEP